MIVGAAVLPFAGAFADVLAVRVVAVFPAFGFETVALFDAVPAAGLFAAAGFFGGVGDV